MKFQINVTQHATLTHHQQRLPGKVALFVRKAASKDHVGQLQAQSVIVRVKLNVQDLR